MVCYHAQENQIMLFSIRVGLISNFGFKGRHILNYNKNVDIKTMEIGLRLRLENARNNGNFQSPVLSTLHLRLTDGNEICIKMLCV